jgi:hypothetical protein
MNNYTDEDMYRVEQKHTHEFTSNVSIYNAHDHRIAGISSEAIQVAGGHIHEILTNTSFDRNHFHRVAVKSSLQIPVTNERHVHFVRGATTVDDNHSHSFEFSTLI